MSVGVVSDHTLRDEVRAVASSLTAAGYAATPYVYERFPLAHPLAARLEGAGQKHEVVIVVLADDTENGEYVLDEVNALQSDDRSTAMFIPIVLGPLPPYVAGLMVAARDRHSLGKATNVLLRSLSRLR